MSLKTRLYAAYIDLLTADNDGQSFPDWLDEIAHIADIPPNAPDRDIQLAKYLKIDASTIDLFSQLPSIEPDSKVCILTHTDLDGAGAPIILRTLLNNEPKVIHCPNHLMSSIIKDTVLNHSEEFDYIIACDISCTVVDADIIDMAPGAKKFILLDHHKTALDLNKYRWAVVAEEIPATSLRTKYFAPGTGHSSGTSLLFDYLYENCPYLLRYKLNRTYMDSLLTLTHLIAAYDTWDWNDLLHDTEPQRFNKICYAYGMQHFITMMVDRIKGLEPLMNDTDDLLLTLEAEKTEEYVNKLRKSVKHGVVTIAGIRYTVAYVYANQFLPSVFEMLNEFGCEISMIYTGTTVSLRTKRDDIDMSAIAKMCGGGGHKKAAGIPIPQETQEAVVAQALGGTVFEWE